MNLTKLLIFINLVGLVACNSRNIDSQFKSDSTKVIEFAIRKAFETKLLPEIKALKEEYWFKDSILFTSDSIPLSLLPTSLDSLKFKIVSKKEILLLFKNDSLGRKLPNYLIINSFEKTDSSYYIQISSWSIVPYGGGGMIGMDIISQKDTFVLKHRSISNIN